MTLHHRKNAFFTCFRQQSIRMFPQKPIERLFDYTNKVNLVVNATDSIIIYDSGQLEAIQLVAGSVRLRTHIHFVSTCEFRAYVVCSCKSTHTNEVSVEFTFSVTAPSAHKSDEKLEHSQNTTNK